MNKKITKNDRLFNLLKDNKYDYDDVSFLNKCLDDENIEIRKSAAHKVGALMVVECFDHLIDIMCKDFGVTFYFALSKFGYIGIDKMIEKLNTNNSIKLKLNLIGMLGWYPKRKSFSILQTLIKDESPRVRKMSVGIVQQFKDSEFNSIDYLKSLLKDEKNDAVLKQIKKSILKLNINN